MKNTEQNMMSHILEELSEPSKRLKELLEKEKKETLKNILNDLNRDQLLILQEIVFNNDFSMHSFIYDMEYVEYVFNNIIVTNNEIVVSIEKYGLEWIYKILPSLLSRYIQLNMAEREVLIEYIISCEGGI